MLTIGQFSLQSTRGRYDIATSLGTYIYSVLSSKVTVDVYLLYGFVTEIWKDVNKKTVLRVIAHPKRTGELLAAKQQVVSYN